MALWYNGSLTCSTPQGRGSDPQAVCCGITLYYPTMYSPIPLNYETLQFFFFVLQGSEALQTAVASC